jgi:hypothetical protein
VRNSPEFQAAIKLNPERAVVKVPLEKALGSGFQDQVLGIKKIGPRVDMKFEPLDFSNGSVQGFYNYNPTTKSYNLETLFPTQYSVKKGG